MKKREWKAIALLAEKNSDLQLNLISKWKNTYVELQDKHIKLQNKIFADDRKIADTIKNLESENKELKGINDSLRMERNEAYNRLQMIELGP